MNAQRTILLNLQRRHPGLMTTGTLWAEVKLDEPDMSYTTFRTALEELETRREVVTITGTERTKAKITDGGLARLAEN